MQANRPMLSCAAALALTCVLTTSAHANAEADSGNRVLVDASKAAGTPDEHEVTFKYDGYLVGTVTWDDYYEEPWGGEKNDRDAIKLRDITGDGYSVSITDHWHEETKHAYSGEEVIVGPGTGQLKKGQKTYFHVTVWNNGKPLAKSDDMWFRE